MQQGSRKLILVCREAGVPPNIVVKTLSAQIFNIPVLPDSDLHYLGRPDDVAVSKVTPVFVTELPEAFRSYGKKHDL